MYCSKCGAQNDENAYRCNSCNEVIQRVNSAKPAETIANHLVQAILVTLFCCLPFGIPAIVYAAQVNGKVEAGDIDGARDCAKKAAMWAWISFGVGLVVQLIYLALVVIGALSGMKS
jgi:hypothetical protein